MVSQNSVVVTLLEFLTGGDSSKKSFTTMGKRASCKTKYETGKLGKQEEKRLKTVI